MSNYLCDVCNAELVNAGECRPLFEQHKSDSSPTRIPFKNNYTCPMCGKVETCSFNMDAVVQKFELSDSEGRRQHCPYFDNRDIGAKECILCDFNVKKILRCVWAGQTLLHIICKHEYDVCQKQGA